MSGCLPFTEDQVIQVYEYFGQKQNGIRNQALLLIGVTTGLRISDILNLKIKDVAFKNLIIKDLIRVKIQKTQQWMDIDLMQVVKDTLKKYVDYLWKSRHRCYGKYLFPSPFDRTKALTDIRVRQIFYDLAKELCISGKISTHSMRKTFARQVYYKYIDMNLDPWPVLMILLGHKNLESTQRYVLFILRKDDKKYQLAFEKISAAISKIPNTIEMR